ncbi:hypothetical protein HOD20_01465 [archaeon]|nr:hypothetical protein [archaeon]MBT4646940.1 hypothetical protein [archaeon]MBT6820792.1 hypothetical protein [archaeon]MBT7392123.1 hypothetical protein [archaeon]
MKNNKIIYAFGIGLVAIIFIVLIYVNNEYEEDKQTKTILHNEIFNLKKEVTNKIEDCLVFVTRKSVDEIGLFDNKKLDKEITYNFINYCLEFNEFNKDEYKITSQSPKITTTIELHKYIDVNIDMPLKIQKEKYSETINRFNYNMKLSSTLNLLLDEESKLIEDQKIFSDDGRSTLLIPAGVKVTYDGIIVENVQEFIVPTKREHIVGQVMYDIKPDGLEFSRPIKLMINYDDEKLPPQTNEDNLRIVYCLQDTCNSVPSIVDKLNNVVTASITHTTEYGLDNSKNMYENIGDTFDSQKDPKGEGIVTTTNK